MLRAAALLGMAAAAAGQVEWQYDAHTPRQVAVAASARTETSLPPMDMAARLAFAAEEDAKEHKMFQFAQMNDVSVSLRDFAQTRAAGGTVYTHTFAMSNALSVAVYFTDFHIPKGGALWAYGGGKNALRGPFTHMNVHPANLGAYSVAHIDGPSVTLEYFQPDGVAELPRLTVGQVATAYRTDADDGGPPPPVVPPAGNGSRRAGRCNIQVACAEGSRTQCSGALWNDASSSVQCVYEDGEVPLGRWAPGSYYDDVSRCVARFTMGGGRCSGSIINTDSGPRWLSAQHCVTSGQPGSYYIELNFKTSCTSYDDNAGNPNQVVTGMSSVGRGGGDIHMFQLNSAIPSSYNAYSCGYDYSRNSAGSQLLGVHHPGAGNMKITNARNGGRASGTCWRVDQWTAATTEPGSSGSPLMDAANQRVIGALCCGTARCPAGYGWDEYGAAFSYSDPAAVFGSSPTSDGTEVSYYPGANMTATAVRPLRDVLAGKA